MIYKYITFFFFNDTATTEIYTLSLHDALPIFQLGGSVYWTWVFASAHICAMAVCFALRFRSGKWKRSEEHTSELQSRFDLVCRLLLEKKKGCRQNMQAVDLRLPPAKTSGDAFD